MKMIVDKYNITDQSGEKVTVEQLMDQSDLVSMLTEAMGKRSGRKTTQPGDCFNDSLCKCRIWDSKTSLPKQCPNAVESDGVCKTHCSKISETDGIWKFGFMQDELPSELLSGKDKGKSIAWKVDGYVPKRRSSGGSTKAKGPHSRPKGRSPKGKVWNYETGQWDDSDVIPAPSNSEYPKKVSELKKLAKEAGITDDELDKIDDSSNRRAGLIKYLKAKGVNPPDAEPANKPAAAPASTAPETKPATAPAPTSPATKPADDPATAPAVPVEMDLLSMFTPSTNNTDPIPEFEPEPEPEPSPKQDDSKKELIEVIFGENTLTFEGVEYMWDKEDNELTDPETYDTVGNWNPEYKIIDFASDEMVDNHKQHKNNHFNK